MSVAGCFIGICDVTLASHIFLQTEQKRASSVASKWLSKKQM